MGKSCKLLRRRVRWTPRRRRDDAELRALGRQFDAAIRRLGSLETNEAAPISRIEEFLASMEPLERAILAPPADYCFELLGCATGSLRPRRSGVSPFG
jgi:hypothetical protein